tara:strand:- start:1626 stop:1931 length:306 start_codon:yes stop_codon:yes gene_type:complete
MKNNQKPECIDALALNDSLFITSDSFEIGANGHTDIQISGNYLNPNIRKLLFVIHTSHGYHKVWCSKIITVDMTLKTVIFNMYEFDSKIKAKIKAKMKYYF